MAVNATWHAGSPPRTPLTKTSESVTTPLVSFRLPEVSVPPHPTDHPGLLRVPGPALTDIAIRFAPLSDRDQFNPASWSPHPLTKSAAFPGWWEIDLDLLALNDGQYEYEFVANGNTVAPDPYADEITRF